MARREGGPLCWKSGCSKAFRVRLILQYVAQSISNRSPQLVVGRPLSSRPKISERLRPALPALGKIVLSEEDLLGTALQFFRGKRWANRCDLAPPFARSSGHVECPRELEPLLPLRISSSGLSAGRMSANRPSAKRTSAQGRCRQTLTLRRRSCSYPHTSRVMFRIGSLLLRCRSCVA